jgi:enoyl-CoA hydratase/carnithine racemase
MTEQVLVTGDSAVRIVRLNRPQKKNALTRASSLSVTARPIRAEAAKAAGRVNDVADAAQVDEAAMPAVREIAVLPAGAVARSRTRLRGDNDDVDERIDVETMHFKERLQSDETSATVTASSLPKM